MLIRHMTICAAMLLGVTALAANSAQALSSKECSAKYKAAKEAGTLNGLKWNEFRKAQCGADATAEPAPAPPPPPAAEKTAAPPPPGAPAAKTGSPVGVPAPVTTEPQLAVAERHAVAADRR